MLAKHQARYGCGSKIKAVDAVTCNPSSLSLTQIREAGKLLVPWMRRRPSESAELRPAEHKLLCN